VMSRRTDEAAVLIERRLAIKLRSRLIDTLSKSRHPPHVVPHVLSTESTGHLALRVQYCHAIGGATERGDDGTNHLLVSDSIRSNELQVWFVAEHVVGVP
jgi:starvation-inducible DNA-binding protein